MRTGNNIGEGPLFSVKDAAHYLGGLSHYTVHAWLSQGKLKRSKVGSRTMIRKSELDKIVQDGSQSNGTARRTRAK